MLGALIPVSDALRTTGGTDLIAAWLSHAALQLPPVGALALILVAAMAVTPFLNNAATVLVMAPIAASFAEQLGYKPDAFLMAVAIGAGVRFPHADRPSVQHAGHGPRRLSLRRLLAARPAAVADRAGGRRAADRVLLADFVLGGFGHFGGQRSSTGWLTVASVPGLEHVVAFAHADHRRDVALFEQVVARLQLRPEAFPR